MRKPFTTLAVAVFTLVAVMHVLRIALGWKVVIGETVVALGGTAIPMWASYLGAVIPAVLAFMLWRESR